MDEVMKEMKVAFDFLLTKKANIKSIIKKHGNINEVDRRESQKRIGKVLIKKVHF